jgi:O-antigen/teichoic acid export membrane protein
MQQLLFKVVTNLGFKGISVVLALAMQVMMARWLTPTEYGQFALMQVVAVGMATFAQAGMLNAYMKLVAELDQLYGVYAVTRVCLRIFVKHLGIAILGFAFVSGLLYYLGKVESAAVLILFAGYMIFQAFMMLLLAWYRGTNKAYVASILEQGSFAGLTVVFGLCWLWYDQLPWGLNTASAAFFIAIVLVFLAAVWPVFKSISLHKKDAFEPDTARIKQLSKRFLTMQMAAYIANWGGVLVVGFLLAADQVAELNVAQRLAQVVVFFLMAFNGVIAPLFAKLNAQGDRVALKRLAQRSALLLTAATIPVVIAAVVFGEALLSVFGTQYVNAYSILLILMVGQFINALTGSVGFLLNMTNHEQVMRNIVITSSVVTILASVVGTWLFGVTGAACAVTLGLAINNLTAAFFVYKYLGFVTIPGLQWVGNHK